MKIKVLAGLFAVALVVSVESFTLQQFKDNESLVRDCVIKIGIGPLAVNRLRKGDLTRDDEKSQCFVKCFMEKTGLMQNDELVESVVIEKLSADVPRDKVTEIYNECKIVKGSTPCETAFRAYECYLRKKEQ